MMKQIMIRKLYRVFLAIGLLAITAITTTAAPGDMDTTFGVNGTVVTELPGYDRNVYDTAIQTDDKIVVAGFAEGDGGRAMIARYNSDGSLDLSFGNAGFVIEDSALTRYFAVAIQTDGKIVATGWLYSTSNCVKTRPWVVRYNSDGSRDQTFGANGIVDWIDSSCSGDRGSNRDIEILPNGKIVVTGTAYIFSSEKWVFAAARLNTDGSFDTTFSGDGKTTLSIGDGDSEASGVAYHARSGRIVLAGFSSSSTNTLFTLVMLNSQGSLDTSFGIFGRVTTGFPGSQSHARANAVVFQRDGKILAAGSNYSEGDSDFALARYNTDGSLDSTFGSGGKVITSFNILPDDEDATDIALHPDGKILVAGNVRTDNGNHKYFALARYKTDGSLDTGFSGDGRIKFDFNNYYTGYGSEIGIQSDGKIVLAGNVVYSTLGPYQHVALARILP